MRRAGASGADRVEQLEVAGRAINRESAHRACVRVVEIRNFIGCIQVRTGGIESKPGGIRTIRVESAHGESASARIHFEKINSLSIPAASFRALRRTVSADIGQNTPLRGSSLICRSSKGRRSSHGQSRGALQECPARDCAHGDARGTHCLISTFMPGARRNWPSVTTFSPASMPFRMTVSPPTVLPETTDRDSARRSDLTTKTYCPDCPVCTACDGTTTALACVPSRKVTLTNWPGHRRRSAFANVPFRRIIPVVLSTVLSTNVSLPDTGLASSLGTTAVTGTGPEDIWRLISGRSCSGTPKLT